MSRYRAGALTACAAVFVAGACSSGRPARGSVPPPAHSIAVSVSLNGLRKVKMLRARETDLEDARELGVNTRRAEPDLRTRLAQAIDALPRGYRTVFVMHDVEGFTHEEIAETLGLQPGTSKAQLSRARARLRVALAAYAGEWTA